MMFLEPQKFKVEVFGKIYPEVQEEPDAVDGECMVPTSWIYSVEHDHTTWACHTEHVFDGDAGAANMFEQRLRHDAGVLLIEVRQDVEIEVILLPLGTIIANAFDVPEGVRFL